MPWRSRSFTIAAESSGVRSVKTGDICGAVTRRMMKANTPTSAAVTAAMAPRRAAPSVRMNSTRPCTDCVPQPFPERRAALNPASFAGFMVSIWLTAHPVSSRPTPALSRGSAGIHISRAVSNLPRSGYMDPGSALRAVRDDSRVGCARQQRRPCGRRPVSKRLRIGRLLPVLLDTRGTQAGQAVTVDRILPGEEFLDGQRVTRARLFERQKPATNRGHHLRLAADDPPSRAGCRQVGDRQGATVGPDDILHPRAMRFGHRYSHTTNWYSAVRLACPI